MASVAYNPDDPTQAGFLSALALGETGGNPGAYAIGVGGADLTGAPTDQYGFPQWTGQGSSHAAGAFQFQPGTFDPIAATHGLNFENPEDQNAAAWYYAQSTYAAAGGGDLETALQTPSAFAGVQAALAKVWPSVTGNAATHGQGLASDLASGAGAPIAGAPSGTAGAAGTPASGQSGAGAGPADFIATVESFFVRFGLIIAGSLIVIVALWQLLSQTGVVPSPAQTAKAAGKGAAALVAA
jgi:muramidase (phage lysozyme)